MKRKRSKLWTPGLVVPSLVLPALAATASLSPQGSIVPFVPVAGGSSGITFVDAHTEVTAGNATSESVAKASISGGQDNDFLFALFFGDSQTTNITSVSDPTGWTEIAQSIGETTAGRDIYSSIHYKYVTDWSAEPTNWTWTWSGSQEGNLNIACFRGVDSTTPLDATTQTTTGSNDGTPDPAAITTVTDQAWVLACHAASHVTFTAWGNPSGYTEATSDVSRTSGHGQGGISYIADQSIGSVNPGAFTHTGAGATEEYHTYTVALRPA